MAASRERVSIARSETSPPSPSQSGTEIIEALTRAAEVAQLLGHLVRFKLTLDRDHVDCDFETIRPDAASF
jgi:hypothetical protein